MFALSRKPIIPRAMEAVAVIVVLMIAAQASWGGSAAWSNSPVTSNWNTAGNWTPATVPNGASDVAMFSNSSQTVVSTSDNTEVAAIEFQAGADAFTISNIASQTLTISGTGIDNSSLTEQNFVVGSPDTYDYISFRGNATAGSLTKFTINAGSQSGGKGGQVWFWDNSSAGQASFVTKGGSSSNGGYGYVQFFAQSSAANGTFLNEGSSAADSPGGATFIYEAFAGNGTFTNEAGTVPGALGGATQVTTMSSAENGTFVNNGASVAGAHGGTTRFEGGSVAANALLIANGGVNGGEGGLIDFEDYATGGTAQVRLFGNGSLDIRYPPDGVTVGSIQGDGLIHTGGPALIVGSNNLSTTFSGIIDGGGSVEKIGSGILTLSGTNAYFSGTTVNAGTLEASHDGALGVGDVSVTSGATLRLQGGTTNDYLADTATLNLVDGSIVDLNFSSVADKVVGLTIDGAVQPTGVYGSAASGAAHQLPQFTGTGTILVTPLPRLELLNISTRLQILTGDNILIGGFIILGTEAKEVIVRGLGPSLENQGVTGALPDPMLELHDSSGNIIATNDNWKDAQQAAIEATGIPPTDDQESAMVQQLVPAAYTVVLRGKNNSTGVGLVEAYDLDQSADSYLANISTRGFVQTGDDVLIGGIILGPSGGTLVTLVVRAIGPSLQDAGVANSLMDPVLSVYDANGGLSSMNDDWKSSQQGQIEATGLAPTDDRESAILFSLIPGNYTAIVTGKDGSTGVALVEVYNLH